MYHGCVRHGCKYGSRVFDQRSPTTTTRSNRGFELSPRVRLSKTVIRNPPRRLHPWHRRRNCKSYTSVSDANRCRRCKNPGGNSTLRSHGQGTTITSCAARSPSRSHRSPCVSSQLMRTKYEHLLPLVHPFVPPPAAAQPIPFPVAPLLATARAPLPRSVTFSAASFRDQAAQNPTPNHSKFATSHHQNP